MSVLADLLDLLFQDPFGVIVGCSVADCLDEALVDAPFVRAFLGAAGAAFDQQQPETTEDLVGMLAMVARGELPKAVSGTSSIARSFLCGCAAAAATTYDTCSSVLDVGLFKQYLVSDARVNDGHAFFLSNPDPADPELKRAIESLTAETTFSAPTRSWGVAPFRCSGCVRPTG